jgi:hypothetical protein
MKGVGFQVQGSEFNLGFSVWVWVQGLGFRGLGFRS